MKTAQGCHVLTEDGVFGVVIDQRATTVRIYCQRNDSNPLSVNRTHEVPRAKIKVVYPI